MSLCSVLLKLIRRRRTINLQYSIENIQSLRDSESNPILFLCHKMNEINHHVKKNALEKVINIIEKMTDLLSGRLQAVIIFLLMAKLLIEVLTRYVLQSPLSIAEEMGGYFLVSITFIGLAYTWKEKGHVRVTLLISRLPEKAVRPIRFITLLLATAFTLPLIKACYDLLTDSLLFESRSGSWLRTPLVYPQSIMLIGAVLLFLQLMVEIIKALIAMKKPGENH